MRYEWHDEPTSPHDRLSATRRALRNGALLISALVLMLAATAQAQPRRHPLRKAGDPQIAVGDLPGCITGTLTNPQPYMQKFHATMLRVVVANGNWHGNAGQALPCISAAWSEGYRVELVVQWNSGWSIKTISRFVRRELSLYRDYITAVALGNEQEIVPPNTKAARYVQVWRAVEPEVRRMAPWATRVGGEISPWGLNDLKQELRLGMPGLQAIGVHPYGFSWGFKVADALRLARQYHRPLWADEGLRDGPDSWPSLSKTIPLSGMRGVAVAGVWDRF